MKKFKLDLSEYEVTTTLPVTKIVDGKEVRKMEDVTEVYPLRNNLNTFLRSFGIFKCGEDIAEAVSLAKQLRECEDESIELDERECDILKQCINRLLELTAEGKANLGGTAHEEVICRVFTMEEIK